MTDKLVKAHHGPTIGCEGAGGNCGCNLTQEEAGVSVPVESRQNIAVRGKKWLLWFKQHNGYVPTHIRVPLPDFIEATIEARMHIIGDQPLLVDRLQMMGIPLTPRL